MPSSKEIKRRIKGIKSMEQITKAMKLVATSKVQKAKKKVEVNRFYFENMMSAVRNGIGESKESKYLNVHDIKGKKKVLYIVLSSDRGLCGGYNINLFKEMQKYIDDANEKVLELE
mgnify:CR=1 FL=1